MEGIELTNSNNHNNGSVVEQTATDHHHVLSDEQAKIYDRQIRLWGVESQGRLLKTRVLVFGMTGLCTEICKNIVLSGVGHVHIMDDQKVTHLDLGCNFLVRESNVGENRAKACFTNLQELNPLMKVTCEEGSLSEKPSEFYDAFDFVVLNNVPLDLQIKVNTICRQKNILFISTTSFGLYVLSFQDYLDNFNYKIKTPQIVEKSESFVSLEKSLQHDLSKNRHLSKVWLSVILLLIYQSVNKSLPSINDGEKLMQFKNSEAVKKVIPNISSKQLDLIDSDLSSFLCKFANTEINSVCAIAGGEIGQEIISVITRDRKPLNNYFIYDAFQTFSGIIETFH